MFSTRASFTALRPTATVSISVANNQTIFAKEVGDVIIEGSGGGRVVIPGVLYAPGLSQNLLSLSSLVKSGASIGANTDGMVIRLVVERTKVELLSLDKGR